MRSKKCAICQIEIRYKSSLKTYCSGRCKQQAYRNKKVREKQNLFNDNSNVKHETSDAVFSSKQMNRFFVLGIERVVSFCQSNSVHESDVRFLKNVFDELAFQFPAVSHDESTIAKCNGFTRRNNKRTTIFRG